MNPTQINAALETLTPSKPETAEFAAVKGIAQRTGKSVATQHIEIGDAKAKLSEIVYGNDALGVASGKIKGKGNALKKIAEALEPLRARPQDPVEEQVTLLIDTADALEAMGLSEDAALALVDKLDDLTEAMSHLSLDRMAQELANNDYGARMARLSKMMGDIDQETEARQEFRATVETLRGKGTADLQARVEDGRRAREHMRGGSEEESK